MIELAAVIDSAHDGEHPAVRTLVSLHHDYAEAAGAAAEREVRIIQGEISPDMNLWTDATVLKVFTPDDLAAREDMVLFTDDVLWFARN